MSVACFIPVKNRSTRLPGKNFKNLNGRPLYTWAIQAVMKSEVFDEIFIDTDSPELGEYARKHGLQVIDRDPRMSQDTANGNDLMVHWQSKFSFDHYFQIFVTSPFIRPETIRKCKELMVEDDRYDSALPVLNMYGYFWVNGVPANYRPGVLPRTQDGVPVVRETTAMYAINAESLKRLGCRIGVNPALVPVDYIEAIDIDNLNDFEYCEYLIATGKVSGNGY